MHFEVSEKNKLKIYQSFGKSKEDIDNDVEIIKKWLKTQKHLPEILDETRIRNFLLLNKHSIEKTKHKLDCYYTIRSVPEWFNNSNPKSSAMKEALESCFLAFAPKLLDDLYCVIFWKNLNPGLYKARESHLHFINLLEVRLVEQFMVGDIIIIDCMHFNFDDYIKHTPALLMKSVKIYQKVFSMRMKGAYFINASPGIMTMLSVFKSILSPKLYNRMHSSPNSSILKTFLPEDIIPKDYSGKAPSLKELNEVTLSLVDKHQDRFDKLDKLRVNESLRPEELKNDEFFGFYGNFKKLIVD